MVNLRCPLCARLHVVPSEEFIPRSVWPYHHPDVVPSFISDLQRHSESQHVDFAQLADHFHHPRHRS